MYYHKRLNSSLGSKSVRSMYHKPYYLLEDTLLEGDIPELEVGILDLDILVVVGCMVEDTEMELNLLKIRKKVLITW